MDYSEISTAKIKQQLKDTYSWLNWSKGLVSKRGGYLLWNGDAEERAEKQALEIEKELKRREDTQASSLDDIITQEAKHFQTPLTPEALNLLLINVALAYAKDVVVRDRENVLRYAKLKPVPPRMTNMDGVEIDENSIINAPMLEELN